MVITVTAGARLPKAQAAHGDDAGWWGWGVRGKGGGVLSGQDKSVGTHTGGILPGVLLLQLHSSPVTPDSFLPPPERVKINSSDRRTAG